MKCYQQLPSTSQPMSRILRCFTRVLPHLSHLLHNSPTPKATLLLLGTAYYCWSTHTPIFMTQLSSPLFHQAELFTDERFQQLAPNQDMVICFYQDSPYLQKYYEELVEVLRSVRRECQSNVRNLRVFYLKLNTPEEFRYFEGKYGIKLEDETFILAKNRYEKTFRQFEFTRILERKLMKYFRDIPVIRDKSYNGLTKLLKELPRNNAVVVFYNQRNDNYFYHQYAKLFHQYVGKITKEKQFIPIIIEDKKFLKDFNLEGATEGSIHMIKRFSNKYDLRDPGTQVFGTKCHVLKNLMPFDKEGYPILHEHLGEISTFSDALPDKFQIVLTVDRNIIEKTTKDNLVEIFKNIRLLNKFDGMAVKLKFGKVKTGNRQYEIKAVDFETRAKDEDESQGDGEKVSMHSYEYLYDGAVNQHSIEHFLTEVVNHKWPEYFQSEKERPVVNLDKLTAENFNRKVMLDRSDHLVLQYSDWCESCKILVPTLLEFDKNNKNKNLQIHRLNSVKNIVPGQHFYDSIPVLLYYRNGNKSNPVQLDFTEILKNPKKQTLQNLIENLPQPLAKSPTQEIISIQLA